MKSASPSFIWKSIHMAKVVFLESTRRGSWDRDMVEGLLAPYDVEQHELGLKPVAISIEDIIIRVLANNKRKKVVCGG
ncbi:hypothetical protein GOBAR_AA23061 [Gossypium barbadense]|uniref:Uncharacterized protein n=1 Tax=Gossypium barbadense TaxID=3634 RepID=A0A2P5X2P2_GOSBA|nr:hypothetical protein GOBAR_AA23061 [Gossypium barbadense]